MRLSMFQKLSMILLIGGVLIGITSALRLTIQDVTDAFNQGVSTTNTLRTYDVQTEVNTSTLCTKESTRTSVLQPTGRTIPFLYIAHTLGLTPEGLAGTNTKEAFEHSYTKGFRLFEADFLRTKDGHILVAHDKHEPFWGIPTLFENTNYIDLQGARYNDTYTPMDLTALLELLQVYPDAHVIIDIKFDTAAEYDDMLQAIITQAIDTLGESEAYARLIPQIYTPEDIVRNTAICNFADILFTQYRNNMPWDDVLTFLEANPRITAIATPHPARFNPKYIQDLHKINRGMYVHPVREATLQEMLIEASVGVFTTVSTTIR